MSDLPIDDKQLNKNRRSFEADTTDKEVTILSNDKLVEASLLVDSATSVHKSQENVDESEAFVQQFEYSNYLFDPNSDSFSTDPNPASNSAGVCQAPVSLPPSSSLSSPQAPPLASPLPSSLSTSGVAPTLQSTDPVLNFGIDQAQHFDHFASQSHHSQTTTNFVPSSIVGTSDNSSSNDFMLFDTSMLDTSTDLPGMSETSATSGASTANKISEYFTSTPLQQTSSTITVNSMSQLNLESHHQQQQQQQQQQQSQPQQSTHQMHENEDFVHYHRMNGNGGGSGGHANSGTPIPNDSNNNPIGEMSEDLKDSMSNMLVEQTTMVPSMPDTNMDSMAMNSNGSQQLSQQRQNQYLPSDVGRLLDNSANANISTSTTASGGSHQQEQNQTLQRMQSSSTSATSTSDSNEPQHNLLNMIPSAFTCLLSDDSEMQLDNVNMGTDSVMGRQMSQSSQHSSGQLQQQQQQGGVCLPVSDESNLYHSHHSNHHQSSTPQHQHAQPPHHQQLSQLQHPAPNSVAIVQNQSNHQMNQQQQQHHPHHQLNQQQIAANVQSTPSMESYGQSQLDMSNSTTLIDSSSTNSSMASLQQQQQSQMPTNGATGSNLTATETMMSQQSVPPPPSLAPNQSSEQTSVDLKSSSGTSFTTNSDNYLLQSQYQSIQSDDQHQQHQLVNRSSASSASPLLASSAGSSHSLHALTNTAHQRTHFMSSNDNNNNNNSNNNNNNNDDATAGSNAGACVGTNQTAGLSANNNNSCSNTSSATNNNSNIRDNNSNNANCSNANSNNNSTNANSNNQANSKNANANSQLVNQFNTGSTIDSISIQSSSLNNQNIGYVLVKREQSTACSDGSKQHQPHQNVFIKCEQQESSSVNYLGAPQSNDQNLYIKCEQSEPSGMNYQDSAKSHQNINLMQYEAHQHQNVPSAGVTSNGNNTTDNSGQHSGSQQTTNRDDAIQQQQLRMVALPNNGGGPINNPKLRPIHVIADPNAPATLPLLQQPTQQQLAQVNLATFPNSSPKIRFTTSLSVNSSQNSPQSVPTTLLFASKSSASAGGHQHHQMHQQLSQTPTSANPNVVQAMILPSNFTFNQAQPGLQPIHQNHANLLTTSGSNLQNVASKNFISHRSISEQIYPRTDIVLQPRQYAPSSMSTSLASINSPVDVHSTGPYQVSVGGSSLFTGSQFGRVQNVPSSSGTSDNRQQPPIFLNSVAPQTSNIILDNYSILSLQPASIPQSQLGHHQSLPSSHHQQSNNKSVPHKILLHSISAPDLDSANNHHNITTASGATLISLNPKFTFNPNVNQLSTLGQLQTSSQSPSLGGNNAITNSVNSNIPSGSIILSSIIQNPNNIPGTAANHTNRGSVATNFAVPIPSAIADNHRASQIGLVQSDGRLTLNPMSTFSQPTLISNLVPTSGSQVVTLATKSTKNLQQSSKSISKSSTNVAGVNSSASSSYSGKNTNVPPLMSGDPAKPFKCRLCDKNLASKNVYQLHLRSHSGEKPFVCQLCHNRFSQKTSLTRHMRSHTGERPFPCEVCNKRFADKERIKIHMRIHTGEKPFSCQICSKKFSQKSTVKRHMSVHTGVKPFKCEVCGKGFANRGNLTAHTKTHQPQQQHLNPASNRPMSTNNRHQQSASSQMPMSHPMTQQQANNNNINNNNRNLIASNNPNDGNDHHNLVASGSTGGSLEIAMNLNTTNQDNNKTNQHSNLNAPTNTTNNNHNQFTSATVQQQQQQQQSLNT